MLLEVKELMVCYDKAIVLNGASVKIDKGELVGIVGPNGAGKSTLLKCIAGLVRWEKEISKGTKTGDITIKGSIVFNNDSLVDLPSHAIAKRGLLLCPERGRTFPEVMVAENLMAGAYLINNQKAVSENLNKVYSVFPILKEREKQLAGTLSGGERQMLAIGRALMGSPILLCIDEPTVGLAPMIKRELFKRIKDIYESGITMLLTEQDVNFAFSLSQRNYVFSRGRSIAEGTAADLMKDENLRRIYLGL